MRIRGIEFLIVVLLLAGLAASLVATGAAEARQRSSARRQQKRTPPRPAVDYTRFSHRTAAHQKACSECHTFPSSNWKDVRRAADAFEDVTEYPRHASCLECHRAQFFAKERPAPRICSVCHVAVTPRATERFPFPNPVERFRTSARAADFRSDFRVGFPHDKHLELFGSVRTRRTTAFGVPYELVVARQGATAAPADASCVNCHTTMQPQGTSKDEYVTPIPSGFDGFWLKKGTFKTAPEGHAKCFECHTADSGMSPAPSDCAVCHKLRTDDVAPQADFDAAAATRMGITDPATLAIWRRRASAATFPHEGGLHTDVSCTKCHDVGAMNTADPRTTRVRVQSCGGDSGCHVTATVDDGGALNYELEQRRSDPKFACAKCHLAYAAMAAPAGHRDAIAQVGKD